MLFAAGVLLLLMIQIVSTKPFVSMTVSFCPTYFSAKGAVVAVDVATGNWTVMGKFDFPDEMKDGCLIQDTPIVAVENQAASAPVMDLMFNDDFALLVRLGLAEAQIKSVIKNKSPFFVGFESFQLDSKTGNYLGVQGTATQSGLCSDGCFEFGAFTPEGVFEKHDLVLFKEVADDARFLDVEKRRYYTMGGYDLMQKDCAPAQADECLLTLDADTGALLSAVWTNFTVYKFAQAPSSGSSILVFTEDYEKCKTPYNSFAFGSLDLATGKLVTGACIESAVNIQMDEWIGSFSATDSLYATASGDTYSGTAQLLVFDTSSGKLALNTDLSGLAQHLGAKDKLISIWSVDFLE